MRLITVISGLLLIPFLTGCDSSASESRRLREDLSRLKERLEKQEIELEVARREAKQAVSAQKELRGSLQEVKSELEAERAKASEVEKAFTDYKNSYRLSARKRAPGTRLPSLGGAEGGVFKDVTVLAVSPGEVRFQHAEGIGTLALGSLPERDRMRFGYDAEEAVAWTKTQQEEALRKEEARERALNFGKGPGEAALLASSGLGSRKKSGSGYLTPEEKNRRQAERESGQISQWRKRQSQILASAAKMRGDRDACPVHRSIVLKAYEQEYGRLSAKIRNLSR